MKKVLTALALSVLSTTAFAAEEAADKSGFNVQVGYAYTGGDVYTDEGSTNTGVAFGANYTFNNGFMIGAMHQPDAYSVKSYSASLEAALTTIYVGYQSDDNWRVNAGVAMVDVEATATFYTGEWLNPYQTLSAEQTYNGFNFGVGYVFDNNVTLDLQNSIVDIEGDTAINTALMLGYKF
ncbi:outer membrane beta-barrel protein [Vibrio vulnificus]|uniref:outer membrane beta-barrel protein n=1 Tax=Vibrio vulnificus TaxID=672 RepID=UPI003242B01B